MKRKLSPLWLLVVALSAITSGCQKQSTENLKIDGNNLILLIDRPTEGINELGRVDWRNRDLAVKELYDFFADGIAFDFGSEPSSYNLYFAFCTRGFDKYGNPQRTPDDVVYICTLQSQEVKKYRSVKFFDDFYGISNTIRLCYPIAEQDSIPDMIVTKTAPTDTMFIAD